MREKSNEQMTTTFVCATRLTIYSFLISFDLKRLLLAIIGVHFATKETREVQLRQRGQRFQYCQWEGQEAQDSKQSDRANDYFTSKYRNN